MNKTAYIIATVLVIAVIVVGFVFFGGSKMPSAPTPPAGEGGKAHSSKDEIVNIGVSQGTLSAQTNKEALNIAATVIYSQDGFNPAQVTINKGETVKWVNRSNRGMWVASDVHPTHQELLGFDQSESVASGEIYIYTFTKAGEWGYHNHVWPKDKGIVVVE